jgi:hypothetical protein
LSNKTTVTLTRLSTITVIGNSRVGYFSCPGIELLPLVEAVGDDKAALAPLPINHARSTAPLLSRSLGDKGTFFRIFGLLVAFVP